MNSNRSTRRNPTHIEHCQLPARTRQLSGPKRGPTMAAVDENGDWIEEFEEPEDETGNGNPQTPEQREAALELLLLNQTREMAATRAMMEQQQAQLLQQDQLIQQHMMQQQAATLLAQQQAQAHLTQP